MTMKIGDLDLPTPTLGTTGNDAALERIFEFDAELESQFGTKLKIDEKLNRTLVSFQANKGRAFYRWFKYKEAFSAALVEHLLDRYEVTDGVLLDPFAGIGTALFAAGEMGLSPQERHAKTPTRIWHWEN
ncbi:MAG: hypothetical protein WD872_18505 [Pirellulaceae bacterium]